MAKPVDFGADRDRSALMTANDLLSKRNAELTFQRDQSWGLITAIRTALDDYDRALKNREHGDLAAHHAIDLIRDAFATFQIRGNADVMGLSAPSAPGLPECFCPIRRTLEAEVSRLHDAILNWARAFNELALVAGERPKERPAETTGL